MSIEDFIFFTPTQLAEARKQAVYTNNERIVNEFNNLFKYITQEVQRELNAKLLAKTQSTWEKTDSKQCSISFFAHELISKHLLVSNQEEIIVSYYSFNRHKNLNERLYDIVCSTRGDKHIKLNYFICDLLIPIISKLEKIGYAIRWDFYTNVWGFTVTWKLI